MCYLKIQDLKDLFELNAQKTCEKIEINLSVYTIIREASVLVVSEAMLRSEAAGLNPTLGWSALDQGT